MNRGILIENGVIKPVDGRGVLQVGDEMYIGRKHFGTVLGATTSALEINVPPPRKQSKGVYVTGGSFKFGIK